MRKVCLMCSAVVFGLMSVASASAGFVVAGPSTKVTQLAFNYTGGLVNVFAPTANPGEKKMFTALNVPVNPSSAYSTALAGTAHNVYLVTNTSSSSAAGFGVTFNDGERIVGVAGSNGGNGLVNNWGSHSSLQDEVLSKLTQLFGTSPSVALATAGAFGSGSNALEIFGSNADQVFVTDTEYYGTVNANHFGGIFGLGDMSLVFTAVPEPSSLGLFAIGTIVVGVVRSRRKKS